MSYLFYFDRLSPAQQHIVLLLTAAFFLVEAMILFVLNQLVVAGLLGLIGTFILGRLGKAIWILPNRQDLPPTPDLLLYSFVLIETLFIWLTPQWRSFAIPQGSALRMDIELFWMTLAVTLVAVSFPAWNDVHIVRRHAAGKIPKEEMFRPVDYLDFLPFGPRRSWSGVAAILIFGCMSILLLAASHDLVSSIVIVIGFMLLAPTLFERIYGYESEILAHLGRGLFVFVALALLLNSELNPSVLSVFSREVVELAGNIRVWFPIWGGAVIFGLTLIWRLNKRELLIPKQYRSHSWYFIVLAIGMAVVHGVWIAPTLKIDATNAQQLFNGSETQRVVTIKSTDS